VIFHEVTTALSSHHDRYRPRMVL